MVEWKLVSNSKTLSDHRPTFHHLNQIPLNIMSIPFHLELVHDTRVSEMFLLQDLNTSEVWFKHVKK